MKSAASTSPSFYRYAPFVVFMAFIGVEELLSYLSNHGFLPIDKINLHYIYPVKAVATGWLLFRFRHHYEELEFSDLKNISATVMSGIVGLLVFVLWINMDWTLGSQLAPRGFDPTLMRSETSRNVMTLFRICGAVLIVPVMEELFWRSFLIRYMIAKNFETVRIGTYTATSFIVTVVLFGFEHNYIFAGMMAGAVYNALLYKYRSLAQCIFSHAVTNLALAVYVLGTSKWQFW